jgi:hypothetical protein
MNQPINLPEVPVCPCGVGAGEGRAECAYCMNEVTAHHTHLRIAATRALDDYLCADCTALWAAKVFQSSRPFPGCDCGVDLLEGACDTCGETLTPKHTHHHGRLFCERCTREAMGDASKPGIVTLSEDANRKVPICRGMRVGCEAMAEGGCPYCEWVDPSDPRVGTGMDASRKVPTGDPYMDENRDKTPDSPRKPIDEAYIDGAFHLARQKLESRLKEKGRGTYASRHEWLGLLEEEMHELREAVQKGSLADVANEALDIAVGCLFGLACVRARTMEW